MNFLKLTQNCFVCLIVTLLLAAQAKAYRVSAGAACKKPNSRPDAQRFYDKVDTFPGWSKHFYKKIGKLKEKHYGKKNNKYVDKSDLHYHVGHGGDKWDWGNWKTLRAIIFKGSAMVPSEAKRIWGNKNLNWIGFRCCKLLQDKSRSYWANSMDGVHLICGFKTNSKKRNDFGKIWAEQMKLKKKVYQAWFTALDQTNQNGVVARVLAEHTGNWNDRLHGYGYVSSDSPVDNYYHYKSHPAGSPPYLQVNHLTDMRIYEVEPRAVDEAYIRDLGSHFGFTAVDPVETLEDSIVLSRPEDPGVDPCDPSYAVHVLQVYNNSGNYTYQDSGRMWASIPGQQFPSPTDAHTLAQNFLNSTGLHEPDALAWDVEYSTMSTAEVNEVTPLETHNIACAVSYARHIEASDGENVSVAGAGARLKVYLDATGGVAGSMGRWRDIMWGENTVAVLTKEEAFSRFSLYGPKVSIEPILVEYNRVVSDLNSATLAYYEHPAPDMQNQLTPIWIFSVDFYDGNELLTTADTFVPSAHEFYPPIANITSPAEGSEFEPNDVINFNSVTDANFGASPYAYEWTSDIDGQLSTAANFSGSLSIACVSDGNSTEVASHIITLKITDATGRSSSESAEVTVRRLSSDLNCDNIVNFGDLAVMGEQWLKP